MLLSQLHNLFILRWPFRLSIQLTKPDSGNTPHRRSTTFSLETLPPLDKELPRLRGPQAVKYWYGWLTTHPYKVLNLSILLIPPFQVP